MEDAPSTGSPVGGRRHVGKAETQVATLAEHDDSDWHAQIDATIGRAHQHAAGAAERDSTSPRRWHAEAPVAG
nr:hypothetical protein [Actinoplanes sp. N902-109]